MCAVEREHTHLNHTGTRTGEATGEKENDFIESRVLRSTRIKQSRTEFVRG